MEVWFWFTIAGTVLAGVSNFIFKLVAKNNFDAEVFSLYGGVTSIIIFVPLVFWLDRFGTDQWLAGVIVFVTSIVAAFIGVWKVYALRFIDATIYFPLFKLLSPTLAIVIGIVLFSESFTQNEWIGLGLGLLVPLLMITPSESIRQNNLLYGLALVGVTGVFSAAIAAVHKFAVGISPHALALTVYTSAGIVVGAWLAVVLKHGFISGNHRVRNVENRSSMMFWATIRSVAVSGSVALIMYAYVYGGAFAIVHTIHSMYILIPIVLAILIYGEHCNWQKVTAVVLSIVSLALLG